MSAAMKYCLTMALCIPTHEDDRDTETASPERAAPKAAKPPAPPKAVAPSDDVTKEVGLLRGLAQTAKVPTDVDALRPRYNALQKVLPRVEWDALGESLKARKTEIAREVP